MNKIGTNHKPRRLTSLFYTAGIVSLVFAVVLSGAGGHTLAAPLRATAPALGAAGSFAVLGGSAVTNTGPTIIGGDLGIYPNNAITGFPPGQVMGQTHAADGVALQAQNDVITAYDALESQPCNVDLTGKDLGEMTLTPGVYCFGSSAGLTGVLTLDGNNTDVWVFKIGSALTTSPGSSIVFTGDQSCNVFWQVTSSATLDTSTKFVGNIIALTSITVNKSASLSGRALARNGAVTLDTNNVSYPECAVALGTATNTPLPSTQTAIPPTATAIAATQTVIAATQTVIAATQTVIAATQTVIISPTQTVIAATQTAIAETPTITATKRPTATATKRPTATATKQPTATGIVTGTATLRPTAKPTHRPKAAATSLPSTGFGLGVHTFLSKQPADKAYANLGDLWLEIPRLGVQQPIVGVPQTADGWDVTWLADQAGWLNGSAFPTWSGNSVLTGHVYDASGNPGPFVRLNQMWYGDKVIVHAWGEQYVYEVREISQVEPQDTAAMLKHQDLPWVTLVTCRGYDAASESYKYRVLVRAVLVEIE